MSETSSIVEINETNINDTLQQSMQVPILLDFWADWCEPCKTLAPVLEKLVTAYKGKFILAKINADDQPMIAQQLGVRSLPTMKLVFKGQLVGELVGAQPEQEIRKLLDQVIEDAPGEQEEVDLMGQIQRARAMGAHQQAIDVLMQALQDEPDNNQYKALIVDLLIDQNKLDEAKNVLGQIADDAKEKAAPTARLAFIEKAEGLDSEDNLIGKLSANEKDCEALYGLSVYKVIEGDIEGALEGFMAVMRIDSQFQEEVARLALLDLFKVLGDGDPLTKKYRRQMFALLH